VIRTSIFSSACDRQGTSLGANLWCMEESECAVLQFWSRKHRLCMFSWIKFCPCLLISSNLLFWSCDHSLKTSLTNIESGIRKTDQGGVKLVLFQWLDLMATHSSSAPHNDNVGCSLSAHHSSRWTVINCGTIPGTVVAHLIVYKTLNIAMNPCWILQ